MANKIESRNGRINLKVVSIVLFCIIVLFTLPQICSSDDHENPSFKYSREANENLHVHKHSHDAHAHSHGHGHSHGGHEHSDHHHEHKAAPATDMSNVWLYSISSTLLISAAPFLLLFTIRLDNSEAMRPRLKVVLAFASGGLLGDAFLHLIPHAISGHHHHDHEEHDHDHDHDEHEHHAHGHGHGHDHGREITMGLWVLAGILGFLIVEKLVRILKGDHAGHSHNHKAVAPKNETKDKKAAAKQKDQKKNAKESFDISGYLNLAADFAHNFTDGLAIGASFLAGNSIGFVTTITILLHEVPHEIGDFAILIKSGCSRRKAMMLQLLTALGALTGNVLALIGVEAGSESESWILPFTAGGFIYISTVSILPELLEESTKLGQSIKEILALIAGVIIMVFISYFE